jgi:DNA repair protein RadC
MNDQLMPDKMSDIQLISMVLGPGADEAECARHALCLVSENMGIDMFNIVRELGPVALKRFVRVQAAVELGRRSILMKTISSGPNLSKPEDVLELMTPIYAGMEREVFYCLCLNTKNRLKKIVEVSLGSINASIVHPRELFREAVMLSTASVVVTHNHPSGDPTPSGADIQLTRRLSKAGDVLGIDVLDHVVIGGGGSYISMRDAGQMM